MSHPSANTAWARSFADELARAGVGEIVLAPGSRSTPLVLAFAGDDRFRMRVHLDERSAAFFALGVGKSAGRPAAVVTTSGTAAANLLPAVVEADESETPLLVLTADRPRHLQAADANQTIDQHRLFGPHVRQFFDAGEPLLGGPQLRRLRALASRAAATATGSPAGPVHVNFPFAKPLEPSEPPADFVGEHPLAASGRPGSAPFVDISRGRRAASAEELDALSALLDSRCGAIVAGPSSEPDRVGAAVWALARRTGFPVLADPLSGARYGPWGDAHVVAAYDLFLRDEVAREALSPSMVVRVGSSPTSAALCGWLGRNNGVPHVVIDSGGRWKDHGSTATHYVEADAADTLWALSERATPAAADEWRRTWRDIEARALRALAQEDGESHEGDVWPGVLGALPAGTTVFVSSSMPVRDLDAFGHPRPEPIAVRGNRGASGIDGIVSTAFGLSSQREGPTVCVLGDLAFFHDQNGLLWSREADAAVTFVLIDNDGGGIFHMLPVADHEPHFSNYVATPHGLDLRHAAALHDVPLHDTTIPQLQGTLREAVSSGATAVVRVSTQRAANRRRHVEVADAVSRSVRDALG